MQEGLHATPCQKCSQRFSAALHVATGRKGTQQSRRPHLVHSEFKPCWQKKANRAPCSLSATKPHTAQHFQGAGCRAHTARTCDQPTWTRCSWLGTYRQADLAVQRATTRPSAVADPPLDPGSATGRLPPPPRTTQRKPQPQTCAHTHTPTGCAPADMCTLRQGARPRSGVLRGLVPTNQHQAFLGDLHNMPQRTAAGVQVGSVM